MRAVRKYTSCPWGPSTGCNASRAARLARRCLLTSAATPPGAGLQLARQVLSLCLVRDGGPAIAGPPTTHAPLAAQHHCTPVFRAPTSAILACRTTGAPLNGFRQENPAHLAQLPEAAKPEEPEQGLGLARKSHCRACRCRPSTDSLSDTASGTMRVFREEQGAGKLPARICGGRSRMAKLRDHSRPAAGRNVCSRLSRKRGRKCRLHRHCRPVPGVRG